MIALDNVSIFKPGIGPRDPILQDATVTFNLHERVGILAAPGTGKSSIARMLSGVEKPDRGHVTHMGRVSWPIGFAGFLHPMLNVRDNLATYASLVGMAAEDVNNFCVDFCGVPNLLDMRTGDLSPTQRALLAYACAVANPAPAMWIADEVITIGEPSDRTRCDQILNERFAIGGLVFLSRNVRLLKLYCDHFYVLLNNRLVPCDDLSAAQEALDIRAMERSLAASKVT